MNRKNDAGNSSNYSFNNSCSDMEQAIKVNTGEAGLPLEAAARLRGVPETTFEDLLCFWNRYLAEMTAKLADRFCGINPKDSLESAFSYDDYCIFRGHLQLIADDFRCNRYGFLARKLSWLARKIKNGMEDLAHRRHGLLLCGAERNGCIPDMCYGLAHALITATNLTPYVLKASDIIADWFARALSGVGNIFAEAEKQAPCVVYIEDIPDLVKGMTFEQHDEIFKTLESLIMHASKNNVFILATSYIREHGDDEGYRFAEEEEPVRLFLDCGLCTDSVDPNYSPADFRPGRE